MEWIRQTLRESRVFILGFLLVEVFFLVAARIRRSGRVLRTVVLSVFVCVTAALLVGASPVGACTCQLRYEPGFLIASGSVLPANAVGLPWWGAVPWEDDEIVAPPREWFRIERLDESGRRFLPVVVQWIENELTSMGTDSIGDVLILVGPKGGLVPGASYAFTYSRPGGDGHPGWPRRQFDQTVEVTVSRERVAWPRSGGTGRRLRIVEQKLDVLETETALGFCATSIPATQLVLELELPAALQGWRDVLSFSVLVDGKVWRPNPDLCFPIAPGRTFEGVARARLFADCSPPDEERRDPPIRKPRGGFPLGTDVRLVARRGRAFRSRPKDPSLVRQGPGSSCR